MLLPEESTEVLNLLDFFSSTKVLALLVLLLQNYLVMFLGGVLSPDESGGVLSIYLLYWCKSTHTDAEVRYMLICVHADAPHPQQIHARLPRQYSYFCTIMPVK